MFRTVGCYSTLVLLTLRGVELSLSAPSSLGQDKLTTADATQGREHQSSVSVPALRLGAPFNSIGVLGP